MARNFREPEAKMSTERLAGSNMRVEQMIAEMPLDELRAARDLTQQHLAELLNVGQAAISKMERRSDMYISTLRQFVKAMGGQLEIRAVFPDGEVRISQFKDLH
jgi:DNA-binding XRE family transcriptional regulator